MDGLRLRDLLGDVADAPIELGEHLRYGPCCGSRGGCGGVGLGHYVSTPAHLDCGSSGACGTEIRARATGVNPNSS